VGQDKTEEGKGKGQGRRFNGDNVGVDKRTV